MRTTATDWTHLATLCESIGWKPDDVWNLVANEQEAREALERDCNEDTDELLAKKWAEKEATAAGWSDEDSKAVEAAFGLSKARAEEAEQAWVDTLP